MIFIICMKTPCLRFWSYKLHCNFCDEAAELNTKWIWAVSSGVIFFSFMIIIVNNIIIIRIIFVYVLVIIDQMIFTLYWMVIYLREPLFCALDAFFINFLVSPFTFNKKYIFSLIYMMWCSLFIQEDPLFFQGVLSIKHTLKHLKFSL